MNNNFTARIKAWMPSFILLCFLFVFSYKQAQAITTTFTTDTSWRVTSTNFPLWNTTSYVLNSSWLVPGSGNTNCETVQTGVVGAAKIWYPATNSLRTCFFRKTFSISQLCDVKTATIEIAAADSYVVYVNGIALGSGNSTVKTIVIPAQILQCENVIAVQARDIDAKCWWMAAKVTINSTPIAFSASSNSSSTNPLCAGQNLNLTSTGLAGATYSWTGPNGFTSNLKNPSIASVTTSASGAYTVIVTVGKCCRYVATVDVNIKECNECLDLIQKEIICKNGIYYETICVKNNSSHVANNINLISTTPNVTYTPNILSPPGGLLPGQTYCQTVVVGGIGATAGATVCLKAMLVEIKNCQQTWFCISKDNFCIKLPDCPIVTTPCNWSAMVKDTSLVICKGTSTMLSAYTLPAIVGASYVWSSTPASVIVNGNTATPTVTPLANPTVYTVTITQATATGVLCTKTATVKVYLKDCPQTIPCDSVKLSFSPNIVTICLGDSVQLNPNVNPSTGLTYLWIPATGLSNATIKNPWAKPLISTTYNLIVSVPGTNCKRDGSMTVIVKPCTTSVPCQWKAVVKDSVLTICRGTSAVLSAFTSPIVAGASYVWTSSPASTIVNGTLPMAIVTPLSSPTIYTVSISVINSDGTVCTKTATVKVFLKDCPTQIPCDSVKLSFAPNTVTICSGDSVQLNPIVTPALGLTYLWTPATGLSSSTIKNPWAKPSLTTSYNLIVSVPGTNCKRDGSMTVVVKNCNVIPNTNRVASDGDLTDEITIAPNPTQSFISVQIPDKFNWETATLINSKGVILTELERTDNAKSAKFDVQSQPSGMYIISVKTDKGFVNKKVIKE
jgi:Secretion system C-terminal sorting domain